MERRTLHFSTYHDVITDLERLEAGYERLGDWRLGQMCRHLSYYFRGSLDGFPFLLPWIVRKTAGPLLLRALLKRQRMPAKGRTIPASVFPPTQEDAPAAAEAKALLRRLENARELYPSPLFGRLSSDQWRALHLLHAAHHLSLLIPREAAAEARAATSRQTTEA